MNNIKATIKEATGYAEEEAGELIGNEKLARKGRDLRNEGRILQGKLPKFTKPGSTTH